MKARKFFAVAVSTVSMTACISASAVERYVDAGWYGKGGNGDESSPFGTIQDAIDASEAGDTIYVAPGTYDKGGKADGTTANIVTNRVFVDKKLTIKSLGSASDTFITGRFDPGTGMYGPAAIRAVRVQSAAAGSRIEGFTLCNSAGGDGAHLDNPDASMDRFGGGFSSSSRDVYLVDCVVSNCWGYYGGGARGGTLVRCLVSDNRSQTTPSACRGTALWNCVIARNTASYERSDRVSIPALGEEKFVAVNCTLACNGGRGASNCAGGLLYNCLFSANDGDDIVDGGSTGITAYNCFTTADGRFPLMGPAVGDWRLQTGSAAVSGGVTSYLTDIIKLPDDIEFTDFYGNKIDVDSDTCAVGAVQKAVTPAAGGMYFVGNSANVTHTVNGNANMEYTYYFPDRWPVQICVRPEMESGSSKEFYSYYVTGANVEAGANARYAQMDGNMWMVPPPSVGSVMTNTAVSTSDILWCKPDADASIADGSEEKPYRTIQAAVDKRASATRCIIKCMPGVYREGGAEKFGASNRVAFAVTRSYLLRGVEGAAQTVIEGAADPDPTYPENHPGCGPRAMRCICFHNLVTTWTCAVQGFTLRNGYSNALEGDSVFSEVLNTNTGVDGRGNRGGAVFGGGDSSSLYGAVQVLDCIITNCAAVRGAAADLTWLNRCRIYGGESPCGIALRGYATSCYFDGSNVLGTGVEGMQSTGILGKQLTTVHCTAPSASSYGSGGRYSDAYVEHTAGDSDYWGSATEGGTIAGALVAGKPLFADSSSGDWRIAEIAPVLGTLDVPASGDDGRDGWAGTYAVFAGGDINGDGVVYSNGKPLPGAWQKVVPVLSVTASEAGVLVNGETFSGSRVLVPGETIVLTPDSGFARYAAGVVVNGTTNLFPEAGGSVSITVGQNPGSMILEAVVSCDWYVNADEKTGNDDNTGFTAQSPFRTLKKALSVCRSGDVVHASPGTYDSETMMPSSWESEYTVRCRAYIPDGVTLVGDEGAEKTFIVGAPSTASDAETSGFGAGRGPGAVRCVLMSKNSVLRGFTLTGGRTDYKQRLGMTDAQCAYHNDYCGAGVYRYNGGRESILVENCIIEGNAAYRGGGGRYATFRKCFFTGNYADYASAAGESDTMQCLVFGNYGGAALYYYYNIESCTFGTHFKADGVTQEACLNQCASPSNVRIANSIFKAYAVGVEAITAENCVFVGSRLINSFTCENCIITNDAAIVFESDYTPVIGSNVAIDAADASCSPGCDLSTDLLGGQRVYNGRMDIGCIEADWRAVYTQAVDARRFNVDAASSAVYLDDASVTVPAGAHVLATLTHRSRKTAYCIVRFEVSEGGSASVSVNGSTEIFAGGVHEFVYSSDLDADTIRFACASGEGALLSVREIRGMTVTIR